MTTDVMDGAPRSVDVSKTKRQNLLFLDFDGVCTSFERGSYLTHPPDEYGPDPKIMDRIRGICARCGARVVVTSNWRRFGPDEGFMYQDRTYMNPLGKLGEHLGNLICGSLPLDRHMTKSHAMLLWLNEHSGAVFRYAILDDDPREGFQDNVFLSRNFWLTNRKYGLTDRIGKEIIEHFEKG